MTQADDNAGAPNTAGVDDNANKDAGAGNTPPAGPPPTSLDAVHQRIQDERGAELLLADPDEAEDNSGDDAAAKAAADAANSGGNSGAGTGDDDANKPGDNADANAGGGDADAAGAGTPGDEPAAPAPPQNDAPAAPPPAPPADPADAPKAPEVDNDITKPGDFKAEFTDEEGNKYYVSDMAQLPDDFEPKSQKDYGMAIQKLTKEQAKFEGAQASYQKELATHDTSAKMTRLTSSWEQEITRLTAEKVLPAEPAERDKVVNAVYDLMEDEMKKGRVIDNWATAHEIYEGREAKKAVAAAEAAAAQAAVEAKKKKGGKVMGGGAPSATGGRPKIMEGPPPGIGLDRVHERVMGSL